MELSKPEQDTYSGLKKAPHVIPVPMEPMRYYAQSHLDQDPYILDLSEHKGNGACQCKSFEIRKLYNINHGMELYTWSTRCKHLMSARNDWADRSLKFFSMIIHEPKYQGLREQVMILMNSMYSQ